MAQRPRTPRCPGDIHADGNFRSGSVILAVGTSLKRIVLLSVPDLTDIAELQHDRDMRGLSFSPLGDMLAGGGADDTRGSEMKAVSWRMSLDKAPSDRTGVIFFDDIVHAFALSPCGKLFAKKGQDKASKVFLVRHFQKAATLSNAASVRCLA